MVSRRVLGVFMAVLAVLALQWLWLSSRDGAPAKQTESGRLELPAEPLALVDQHGQPVQWGGPRERHQVVVFGYTYCPDICPTTLSTVALALDELGESAEAVQPVFVTLDPARDRPELLRDYVAAIDPRLLALTGSQETIEAAAEAFRVHFAKAGDGDDYLMDHSAAIYLVAPDGASAAYFRHDLEAQALAQALRLALDERQLD